MNLRLDFAVRRGEFELAVDLHVTSGVVALFGPSGSGKTTLLHTLCGLCRPTRGRAELAGQPLFDVERGLVVPTHARRVGIVFQELRLFPHLTAFENLVYGHRRVPAQKRRLVPAEVAEALDIGRLGARRVAELSGGERQRVALGRALLAMPRLLLMDEPLASVDVDLRRQILPYLRWVHAQLGVPIVHVSHSLPEILELTDTIVVLEAGRVRGHGEVFDVLGRALHGALDEPFSTESWLRVEVAHTDEEGRFVRARVASQEVTLPFRAVSPGTQARVAVRPADVILARAPVAGISARNQLRGRVVRVTPLRGHLLVHVDIGDDAVVRAEITDEAFAELGLSVGGAVHAIVKTSAFRWAR